MAWQRFAMRPAPANCSQCARRQSCRVSRYFVVAWCILCISGDFSMKAQMVKWGNSLAVRIPKPAAEKARLKEGDILEVEASAEGQIELRRARKIPTLAQLVDQITPQNRYGEISSGAARGKESVEW